MKINLKKLILVALFIAMGGNPIAMMAMSPSEAVQKKLSKEIGVLYKNIGSLHELVVKNINLLPPNMLSESVKSLAVKRLNKIIAGIKEVGVDELLFQKKFYTHRYSNVEWLFGEYSQVLSNLWHQCVSPFSLYIYNKTTKESYEHLRTLRECLNSMNLYCMFEVDKEDSPLGAQLKKIADLIWSGQEVKYSRLRPVKRISQPITEAAMVGAMLNHALIQLSIIKPAFARSLPHLFAGANIGMLLSVITLFSSDGLFSRRPEIAYPIFGICLVLSALCAIDCEVGNFFMYGCRNGYALVEKLLGGYSLIWSPDLLAQHSNYAGFREAIKGGHPDVVDILLSNNAWFDIGINNYEPIVSCLQNSHHHILKKLITVLTANNQLRNAQDTVNYRLAVDRENEKISRDEYLDFMQFLDWHMLDVVPDDNTFKSSTKRLMFGCVHDVPTFVTQAAAFFRKDISTFKLEKIDCGRGCSPLHLAVRFNSVDVIKSLLKLGHAVNCVNTSGETPLELTRKLGNKDAEALLLTSENINFKELPGFENRKNLIEVLGEELADKKSQDLVDNAKYICGLIKHKHDTQPLIDKLAHLKPKNIKNKNNKNNDIARNIVSYLDGGDIVKKSKMQLLEERWDRSLDYAL